MILNCFIDSIKAVFKYIFIYKFTYLVKYNETQAILFSFSGQALKRYNVIVQFNLIPIFFIYSVFSLIANWTVRQGEAFNLLATKAVYYSIWSIFNLAKAITQIQWELKVIFYFQCIG